MCQAPIFLISYVRRKKDTVAYLKSQQRKKEIERLGGEGDKIKLIDLRLAKGQIVGLEKGRRGQNVSYVARFWDECIKASMFESPKPPEDVKYHCQPVL